MHGPVKYFRGDCVYLIVPWSQARSRDHATRGHVESRTVPPTNVIDVLIELLENTLMS